MPSSILSEALKEAYASADAEVIVYHTLEIAHPAFTETLYVVRDWEDLNAYLEDGTPVTFTRFAFRLVQPEVSPEGVPIFQLEIDNVNREIVNNMQLATQSNDPVKITYREYISTDLSGPQNDPPLEADLSNVKATVFLVTAQASFGNYRNKRFPNEEYTSERFPGLVI